MSLTSLLVVPDEILQFLNPDLSVSTLRIFRLPHPRTGDSALFVSFSSLNGREGDQVLELQAINPDAHRSWLYNNTVTSNGKLVVTAVIDPAYILAPLLRKHAIRHQSFLDSDSLLDSITLNDEVTGLENELDFRAFISLNSVSKCLHRMCESKHISTTGVVTYLYSEKRWLQYLKSKVESLYPLFESDDFPIIEREHANDGLYESGKEELLKLGRIKSACDLICHYLPADMHPSLLAQFDFTSFDEHIGRLREEEVARLSLNSGKKPKANGTGLTKRKAANQISRGADKLKKADKSGITKISSFFQKAAK